MLPSINYNTREGRREKDIFGSPKVAYFWIIKTTAVKLCWCHNFSLSGLSSYVFTTCLLQVFVNDHKLLILQVLTIDGGMVM